MKGIFGLGMMMVGAAIGAGATYIFMNEKYKAEREENNKAMWAYVERELAKQNGTSEATEQDREKEARVKEKMEKLSIPYSKVSKIESKDPIVIRAEQESPVEHPGDIYEIKFTDFEDGEPTFEKLSLTYYQGDHTLTDDLDEMIDIDDVINEECLARFDESEENVLYFRNVKNGCDYEIIRALGNYGDRLGDI